jgi:hypothetical protein
MVRVVLLEQMVLLLLLLLEMKRVRRHAWPLLMISGSVERTLRRGRSRRARPLNEVVVKVGLSLVRLVESKVKRVWETRLHVLVVRVGVVVVVVSVGRR